MGLCDWTCCRLKQSGSNICIWGIQGPSEAITGHQCGWLTLVEGGNSSVTHWVFVPCFVDPHSIRKALKKLHTLSDSIEPLLI